MHFVDGHSLLTGAAREARAALDVFGGKTGSTFPALGDLSGRVKVRVIISEFIYGKVFRASGV